MTAPDDAGPPSHPGDKQAGSGTHTEHEDHPWTRRIPDHPPRKDSPAYVASRKLMNKLAHSVTGFFYGAAPYEDHHGGGLWVKDADGGTVASGDQPARCPPLGGLNALRGVLDRQL